jgi:hypothetical protein
VSIWRKAGAERIDPERFGARGDAACKGFGLRRTLCVAVVFEHDEQRQTPLRGDIQRLVQSSLSERPIADEYHDDVARGAKLVCERKAGGDRCDAALNAVAEHAVRANVLAAAAPAADAGLFPHDLGEQAIDVVGAREVMAVAPVIAENLIAVNEVPCDGEAGQFLADARMDRSKQLPCCKQVEKPLLEPANQQGARIEIVQ